MRRKKLKSKNVNDEIQDHLRASIADYFNEHHEILATDTIISPKDLTLISIKKNKSLTYKKDIDVTLAVTVKNTVALSNKYIEKPKYFSVNCLLDRTKYSYESTIISVTPKKHKYEIKSEKGKQENYGPVFHESKITYITPAKDSKEELYLKLHRTLEIAKDKCCYNLDVGKLYAELLSDTETYKRTISEFQYIDGVYVKPYAYKENSISEHQTYALGIKSAAIVIASNEFLRKSFVDGKLKYVEYHICINNPKYITKDDSGEEILTKYARQHMHECCLVFNVTNKYSSSNSCKVNHNEGYKNSIDYDYKIEIKSNCRLELVPRIQFSEIANRENCDVIEKMISEYEKDVVDIFDNLPNNFGKALKMLRKRKRYTQELLAEKASVSIKTIGDLEGNKRKPSLETVMALVIALELPPMISIHMVGLAGYNLLTSTTKAKAYNFLIFYCSGRDIKKCNEILRIKFGLPRLTEKE